MIGAGILVLGWLAQAAPADPAVRVQLWLDSWDRLGGAFEQVVSSPTLPSDQVETGRFEVSRPDRMRWDYLEPERKLAVTDGEHTWLYLPDDRQVVRGTMEQLRRDSAVALLLTGSLRLEEAFIIERAETADGEIHLLLRPRRESEAIAVVVLSADENSGAISGLTVTDPAGNRVTWRFRDVVRDPDLDEARFVFRIPEGMEIQDLESAEVGHLSP
jgi:outer membrane lipoprotein carrier protein